MHQDNKIIISAVLILTVAMVSFNFGSLSGKVSSGNVACKPITVQAGKESVWLNMRITIPEDSYQRDYNGVDGDEIIIRRVSGERVADVRIPRDVLNDNTMVFRIQPGIENGWAGVKDKCTGEEIKVQF